MINPKINRKARLEFNMVLPVRRWAGLEGVRYWLLVFFFSAMMTLIANRPTAAEPIENKESSLPGHQIEQQLNFTTSFETNRTLGDCRLIRGGYQLEYDTHFRLQTGLSYNFTSGYINALFVELGYEKISDSHYSIRLKFLGNQYGEYGKAANSIIPYMSVDNSVYFIEAGLNCRFTITNESQLWNMFYYQNDNFQVTPYYRFALRFSTKGGRHTVILALQNCDEIYAGNLGAYRFRFNYNQIINEQVTAFANLDFWQSGGIAMGATYYKTGISGGIEVKL